MAAMGGIPIYGPPPWDNPLPAPAQAFSTDDTDSDLSPLRAKSESTWVPGGFGDPMDRSHGENHDVYQMGVS